MAAALPDISLLGESRSLPAAWYCDDRVLEIEKQELFYKNWHYVCHSSQVDSPGKFVTAKLFEQEFFVVGGKQDEIRAFYNVCPHRAHRLVDGAGEKRRIVCPYHRWTYDLQGKLIGARGLNDEQAFSRQDICLSEIRVECLLGFVFINLDAQAESLSSYAGALPEQVLKAVPDLDIYELVTGSDYFGGGYQANWKVMLDNFLECYHCESAHPSFVDMLDMSSMQFSFHGNFSYQIVQAAIKEDYSAYPINADEDATVGHFWYLFPNIILTVFPGARNLAISRCDPLTVNSTVRYFDMLIAPDANPERLAARAEWGMNVVNEEDKSLCENVQLGLQQRGFSQGYYLVDSDNGNITEEAVRFFHRHYAKAMADKLNSAGGIM